MVHSASAQLQLISLHVGRISCYRDLLASIFLPLNEGHVLSYVSQVNVISGDLFIPSFFLLFYILWKTMTKLYNIVLLVRISTILNVMDTLKCEG